MHLYEHLLCLPWTGMLTFTCLPACSGHPFYIVTGTWVCAATLAHKNRLHMFSDWDLLKGTPLM